MHEHAHHFKSNRRKGRRDLKKKERLKKYVTLDPQTIEIMNTWVKDGKFPSVSRMIDDSVSFYAAHHDSIPTKFSDYQTKIKFIRTCLKNEVLPATQLERLALIFIAANET